MQNSACVICVQVNLTYSEMLVDMDMICVTGNTCVVPVTPLQPRPNKKRCIRCQATKPAF